MSIPSNLIINADDFGATSTKNAAISKCFVLGIINSTSIMANMECFQDAINISKENGFQDRIGLHVNLTEGRPLTDLSGTKLVNDEGLFIKENADKKFIYLSQNEKRRVITEIDAQLNTLYMNNIKPTHINSHHHVHTLPWLAPSFLAVAKKFSIKIRIAQTWNKNDNILVPLYRRILNRMYKRNQLNFTNRFETFESYNELLSNNNKNQGMIEIMVHPDLDANNEICDSYDGSNLGKQFS
jgi:predicted glycoside hydrolase/deacetylase ChbG (UPF0249 family)